MSVINYIPSINHVAILFIYRVGTEPNPLLQQPFIGLLYQPWIVDDDDDDDCGAIIGMNKWQRKPKYSEGTCRIAALSSTDSIILDPGLNPGRRRLSYGADD
jgi:hypothetical protein